MLRMVPSPALQGRSNQQFKIPPRKREVASQRTGGGCGIRDQTRLGDTLDGHCGGPACQKALEDQQRP